MQTQKNKLSEEQLIIALQQRQKAGMEALYRMYAGSLLGVISRIIPQTEIAEDVLQEAFVKIWNSISSYNSTKGRLYTWMMNISRNLAIDKVRSKDFRNHSQNQELDNFVYENGSDSLQHSTRLNEDTLGIKQLAMNLKTELKEILDLIYFKGYTHVEVSEKLEIPLGTVKTRLRIALTELRKNFNQ